MRDLDREQLIAELRRLRPTFEQDGVTHMALFGSRARRDNRPDSDVDVLIEVDRRRKFSLLDLVGVGHHIEDRLGLQSSIVIRDDAPVEFIDRVLTDAIHVF